MTLHPDSIALLEELRKAGEGGALTVSAAREAEVLRHQAFDMPPEEVQDVSRQVARGPAGDIPLLIYTPQSPIEGIVVHFHGGGWTIGSPEVVDPQVRTLANAGSCVVVSVDYRLAPEYPFPDGLADAYAATRWTVAHATELGSSPDRVVVGGSSSGGNLAAAVCVMSRDRGEPDLAGQLLIYPALHHDHDSPSRRLPPEQVLVPVDALMWFWDQYLSAGGDPSHPYVSPLRADLGGLPPAIVVTAEYDVLRDEGEEYARRLQELGIPTWSRRFEGMLHAFLAYARVIGPASEATAWIGQRLRDLFAAQSAGVGSEAAERPQQ